MAGLLSHYPLCIFLLAATFFGTLTLLHLVLTGQHLLEDNATSSGVNLLPTLSVFADWERPLLAPWARFDALFFLSIAQHGYTNQGLTVHFPLYPLLVHSLVWLLNDHAVFAAMVISWACCWGCYECFYRLAKRECGEQVARLGLLFLAFCPESFFTFAPYSESLFLLLSFGAIERARAGRLWQANALGGLAMLTRSTGILLVIPLGWEWARRNPFLLRLGARLRDRFTRLRQRLNAHAVASEGTSAEPTGVVSPPQEGAARLPLAAGAIFSLGLIPLALGGYMLYLHNVTGNFFAFVKGQDAWHRSFTWPWQTASLFITAFQRAGQAHDLALYSINVLDLLLILPLTVLVLYYTLSRRNIWLGAAFYQLALVLLLLVVPAHPWPGVPYEVLIATQRYLLPAFPIFLLMGQLGVTRPKLYQLVLVSSVAVLVVFTLRFLSGYFIA
ncbi:MAG TPA: mannosyltransferase family protein [Ktedonobacterales bacterium]